MIHKQYNEIMANSKKKFSNLYSVNDVHHLHNQGLSNLEIANILPIHVSSVKRILNGKGLIKYKDKFKNYEQ